MSSRAWSNAAWFTLYRGISEWCARWSRRGTGELARIPALERRSEAGVRVRGHRAARGQSVEADERRAEDGRCDESDEARARGRCMNPRLQPLIERRVLRPEHAARQDDLGVESTH